MKRLKKEERLEKRDRPSLNTSVALEGGVESLKELALSECIAAPE